MPESTYFISVAKGSRRGIFCDREGFAYSQKRQYTEAEMQAILGPFETILDPQSIPLTKEQMATHVWWISLPEYSNELGIASPELWPQEQKDA